MKQHVTALMLALGLFVGGTTACSKKEDATPAPAAVPAIDTGNYKLDGKAYTCTAKCLVAEDYDANKKPIYILFVYLNDGQNNTFTTLTFKRPFNTPKTDYQLQQVGVNTTGNSTTSRYYTSALRYSLTETKNGFSGTFEATSDPSITYLTSSVLTAGAFNAQF
jgi:hypothetical protein